MEMVAQKFESFEEIKDEEYRYWASRPAAERIAAGHQMSVEGYRAHGYSADGRKLKKLLSAFNANQVKYVVIGGYAVFVHAQPRMTKDLDVFIESSPENALATYKGLAEFGAPLEDFSIEDFTDGKTVGRFGVPPICFEVIQRISGVDFAAVYKNSVPVMIDGEVSARYISAEDLITNKLASGRPQDLADVDAIRNRQRATGKR